MKKIRAAVVGYGNIGKFTIQALEAAADFEIAGVVRRNGAADKPLELTPYEVVKDIKELKDVERIGAEIFLDQRVGGYFGRVGDAELLRQDGLHFFEHSFHVILRSVSILLIRFRCGDR